MGSETVSVARLVTAAKLLELRDAIAARTEEALVDTSERDALRERKAALQQRVDAYTGSAA
jgi:hypothetical protein